MSSYARMWFGTEDKMQWIDCPLQGADVSPLGWSAEGTLLNGGGYATLSFIPTLGTMILGLLAGRVVRGDRTRRAFTTRST